MNWELIICILGVALIFVTIIGFWCGIIGLNSDITIDEAELDRTYCQQMREAGYSEEEIEQEMTDIGGDYFPPTNES